MELARFGCEAGRAENQTYQMANTPIVRHISESFIKPKYKLEDAINPVYLAPGDLIMLSAHYIQKGLLFPKPSPTVNNLLDNLKHSLSLTLVHFYPLAGQFETEVDEDQHTSLVFIDCNKGLGARLIHATLDMSVSEILSPEHVPPVVQSFFDHDRAANHDGHTRPLLSIQVTELLDGVFIGCSMNHVCGDGTSFWNFFNTLSEIFMANGELIAISRPPIHKRWFVDGAGPIIKLPYTHSDEFVDRHETPKMIERIFHFSAESVAKLKAKANEECESSKNMNISSFQALSAFVWKSITKARGLPDDVETVCRLAINNRGRLDPPLSSNSFGNAVHTVQGATKVDELMSHDLGWAASLMHRAVVGHTNETLRSALKVLTDSPFVIRIGDFMNPYVVHIGSSPRFDMYGPEFGMGKGLAILSGYANKFDGKVSAFPSRDGGGSIDLETCLLPDHMRAIEADEEFMAMVS